MTNESDGKEWIRFSTITLEELEQLPGISESVASGLIKQRNNLPNCSSFNDFFTAVDSISRTLASILGDSYIIDLANLEYDGKTASNCMTKKGNIKRQLRESSLLKCKCDGRHSPCKKYRDRKLSEKSSCCRNYSSCNFLVNDVFGSVVPGDVGRSDYLESSPDMQSWLDQFNLWSREKRLYALNNLISGCDMSLVRHMMSKIEPHFQRDFIALLPKELALYVLSFLDPKDLCRAAQTCRYWRILTEDNLLWKEKCKEYDVLCSIDDTDESETEEIEKPYKQSFLYCHKLEMNWRSQALRPAKHLRGHDDHVVTCLEFDGVLIVSGSDDNTLKVWSAVTGNLIRTLVGHTGGVWSSQLKDDIVVSGSTDRTLRVWNAFSGVCSFVLQGHTSTVRCLAMYKNSIVSGSRDGTLRVWDVLNGQCLHVLIGHAAAVRCVQFDGKRVVSGAYDYLVKIWDVDTEVCLHTLSGHSNRVYSLQFDGKYIVSGSLDTSIRVWDAYSGQLLHTLLGHQSLTSGMVLKSNHLVSGNADSTVKIWDIATGKCLHTLSGPSKHQSAVTSLQFNSRFVVTSSDDGSVKLWDMKSGDFIRDLVELESGGSGGVVWRVKCNEKKLVCAVGSRNGTEETKLLVLDFDVYT